MMPLSDRAPKRSHKPKHKADKDEQGRLLQDQLHDLAARGTQGQADTDLALAAYRLIAKTP